MSDIMTANRAWSCLDALSLEMTAKDIEGLTSARGGLASGTVVAVPYLPHETDSMRIRSAALLRAQGFSPMPHIAARRVPNHAALEALLDGWAAQARIDRLVVIAGDCTTPEGPFADSLAVLRTGLPARYGVRTVAVSGYPEGHPKISATTLEATLRDKLAMLADQNLSAEIATQFSFSAAPVLSWLAGLRAKGVQAPVRLGIPGPASARTLLRYATMCGVGASASVLARYGLSLTKLMNNAGPDKLVQDLAAGLNPDLHGRVTAHFYPFGGLPGLLKWLEQQDA